MFFRLYKADEFSAQFIANVLWKMAGRIEFWNLVYPSMLRSFGIGIEMETINKKPQVDSTVPHFQKSSI